MFFGLAEKGFDVGMGAKADDLQAFREMLRHFEAIRTDGAGGAKDDQTPRSADPICVGDLGEPGRVSARSMGVCGGHDSFVPWDGRGVRNLARPGIVVRF